MTDMLPKLPRQIGQGVLWVVCAAAVASWAGWLETPGSALARDREQVSETQRRVAEIDRLLVLLQYQVGQALSQQALARADQIKTNDKLDEMSMVLYSLERRSR